MLTMQAGELSRNKHFDAYQDPLVRQARRRQTRLESLARTLADPDTREVSVRRDAANPNLWRLRCLSDRYGVAWSASLLDFEIEMLAEHPMTQGRLDAHLPDKTATLFQ